jgi:hypothetical protein|eukprot:COSAG01_NODE_4936_length_4610_cov_4.930836_5_plen_53_part_00
MHVAVQLCTAVRVIQTVLVRSYDMYYYAVVQYGSTARGPRSKLFLFMVGILC